MRYAFIRTCKPILDDARYRSFDTMAEYRKWCEENLPKWSAMAAFEYRQAEEIGDTFAHRKVRYLFLSHPTGLPRHDAGRASVRRKEARELGKPGAGAD